MTKLNVIDPVLVKKQVLKAAVEAATSLLKIDDVIGAAPKKEEKKGKEEGGETSKMPELD